MPNAPDRLMLFALLAGLAVLVGCSNHGGDTPPAAANSQQTARVAGERSLSESAAAAQNSPASDTTARESTMQTQKATFGAGCFWGVEETFRKLSGVVSTAVGYSGGRTTNPTYRDVCGDGTGHAEVVQVEYDPARVSYDQLLDVFWACHNPTTPNRQGPDVGSQYRSAIFYHTPEQQAAALASKERLEKSGKFGRPIVTQIEAAQPFWRAEEYHQQYLAKRGQASCGTGH